MKATFYYSDFRRHVIEHVSFELEHQGDLDEDIIYDLVNQVIENECIYYADCWAIALDLAPHDWSDLVDEFGPLNNITSLAYAVLYNKVQEDEHLTPEAIIEAAKVMVKARNAKSAPRDGQPQLFNFDTNA